MGLVIYLYMLCISFPAPLPPVSAVTPLVAEQFAWELRFHPQQPQVDFVLDGIRHGFKLGFSPSQKLKSAKKNKPSATQHASVIDAYLANEVSLGRVAGPFNSPPPFPNLQISSFGVIPKKGQPGKWRLIVDLSSPWGASVNDGIAQKSLLFITSLMIKLFAQCLAWGKGPSWLNLMLSPRTAMFLFTRLTVTCWG